jgi:hypothetical protein
VSGTNNNLSGTERDGALILPVVLTADLRQATGGHCGVIGDMRAYVPPVADRAYPSFMRSNAPYSRSDSRRSSMTGYRSINCVVWL